MSLPKFGLCLAVIIGIGMALRGYTRAVPDLPVEQYVQEGRELQKQQLHSQAIRYYTAAIQKEPRNWDALARRGMSYAAVRDFPHALEDLDSAIEFSHGTAKIAYLQRGYLYLVGGKFDEALADANHILKLDPKDPLAYALRSTIYGDEKRGDASKSKADYETALALASPELRDKLEKTAAAARKH